MNTLQQLICLGLCLVNTAYGMEESFAIGSESEKKCFQEFVIKSGEYELFKVVHKILALADSMSAEVKNQGVTLTRKKLSVNFCKNRTKQGLLMEVVLAPKCLYTPWGAITLFSSVEGDYLPLLSITQEFFKRMKTTLHSISTWRPEEKWRIISEFIDRKKIKKQSISENIKEMEALKKMSQKKVKKLYGTECLVAGYYKGDSSEYAIHQFEGTNLVSPVIAYGVWHNEKVCKRLWQVMTEMYEQEQLNQPK